MFTFFLTAVFIFMALYSMLFVNRLGVRFILLVVYGTAIFLVWNPLMTTRVANMVGIGRGLDFILLLFFVAVSNILFFMIMHLRVQNKHITKLTRYIALLDVRHKDSPKNTSN